MKELKDFIVKKKYINQIPMLLIFNEEKAKKPIIFLFHKILEDKTKELPLALTLAQNGFFVVTIDMHGHGERENSYYAKKVYDFNGLFKDIYATAEDIKTVIEFLRSDESLELDYENIGAIGVSIGGSVALVSSYLIKEIKFVASVIGTCNWEYLVENDLFKTFKYCSLSPKVLEYDKVQEDILKYEHCNNITSNSSVPILFQHGSWDFGIPIHAVREYYDKLLTLYSQYGKADKLKLIKYEKAGHKITNEMEVDLVNWVKQNITSNLVI